MTVSIGILTDCILSVLFRAKIGGNTARIEGGETERERTGTDAESGENGEREEGEGDLRQTAARKGRV